MKSKKNICLRKQIVAYLMIISLLCLCCGCAKDKNEKESAKTNDTEQSEEIVMADIETEEKTTEDTTEEVVEVQYPREGEPEDVEIYEIYIDGLIYKMPLTLNTLPEGWVLEGDDESINDILMDPNSVYTYPCRIKNDKYDPEFYIDVQFRNRSEEVQKIQDCEIEYMMFALDHVTSDNYPKICFKDGIAIDASKEEIIAAYGQPLVDEDLYIAYNMYYENENLELFYLDFYFDNDKPLYSHYRFFGY